MFTRRAISAAMAACLVPMITFAACSEGTAAENGADFSGDTIKFIIPFSPGGGVDNTVRLISEYLPKFLKGEPRMRPEFMAGGGGVLGANAFMQQEPDGLTLLAASASNTLGWLMGLDGAEYDPQKLKLLWAFPAGTEIYVNTVTGVETVADLSHPAVPLVYGGRQPTNSDLPVLLGMELLGIADNVRFVWGYEGGADSVVAFESKEINLNRRQTGQSVGEQDYLFEQGTARHLYTHGELVNGELRPDSMLPDIPTIRDAYKDLHNGEEPSGNLWDDFLAVESLLGKGRNLIWVHGDAPQEKVDALRAAFAEMSKDPEFVKRLQVAFGPYPPIAGESAIGQYMDLLLGINKGQLDRIRKLIAEKYPSN